MKNIAFLLALCIAGVTACGGSSGGPSAGSSSSSLSSSSIPSASSSSSSVSVSSSSSSSESTLEQKLAIPPSKLTAEELQEIYSALAWSRYQGDAQLAEITPVSAQAMAETRYGDRRLLLPAFPLTVQHIIEHVDLAAGGAVSAANSTTSPVEFEVPCTYDGSVRISGDASPDGLGNFSIQFRHCSGNSSIVNGTAAVSYLAASNGEVTHRIHYYQNLAVERETHTTLYSGYYSRRTDPVGEQTYTDLYILGELANGYQFLYDIDGTQTWHDGYMRNETGRMYRSDIGYFDVGLENTAAAQLLRLKGSTGRVASIESRPSSTAIWLRFDENGDGADDVGAVFPTASDFFEVDIAHVEFVDVAFIGLPPYVYVWISNWSPLTTEPITASVDVVDADTAPDQLNVSYRWTVNDKHMEAYTGDTLPAGVAVSGDIVTVQAIVNDGFYTAESDIASVIVADSPAVINVAGAPETAVVGDTVEFQVTYDDPDNAAVQGAVLAYAPAGTTMDSDGKVTWLVDRPLFSATTVSFGFKATPEAEDIEKIHVAIVADSVPEPIARSGIEVPHRNDAMHIGDFRGDSSSEILAMDRRHRFFLLSETDGHYAQTWMYPYQLPYDETLVQVLAADLDDDVQQEIVVAGTHNVYLLASTADELRHLQEIDQEILSIAVHSGESADQSLLAIYSRGDYSSGYRLDVLELGEQVSLVFQTAVPDVDGTEVLFANVDEDDAVELVLDSGLVYDTESWMNQWYEAGGFAGSSRQDMLVTDIDEDGFNEIVTISSFDGLKVFSAISKQLIAHHSELDGCALGSAESDGPVTIVIGSCHWSGATGYVWSAGSWVEQWFVESGYGVRSIVSGDIDGDGEAEVAFGAGQGSTGKDSLVVVGFAQEEPASVIWNSESSPQLDSFAAAGWGEVTPGEELGVFIVPNTNSGYDGQRLVMMSPDGEFTISEQISDHWDGGKYGKVTDFNLDGYADIFLATSTYDGSFAALQLSDMTNFWTTSGDSASGVKIVESFDFNDDSMLDAVYVNGAMVSVVDIANAAFLGGLDAGRAIQDLAIADVDGLGQVVVVATHDTLQVHSHAGSTFSRVASAEQICSRIAFGNFDGDEQLELACAESYWSGENTSIVIYELGAVLSEKTRFTVEGEVTDFVVDSRTDTYQNLLAGTYRNEYSCTDDYCGSQVENYIAGISPTGGSVWRSPAVIGQVVHRSMHFRALDADSANHRLMFATPYGMYQIH